MWWWWTAQVRGMLEELKDKEITKEETEGKGRSFFAADGRESRVLDVFWFLKPCTHSSWKVEARSLSGESKIHCFKDFFSFSPAETRHYTLFFCNPYINTSRSLILVPWLIWFIRCQQEKTVRSEFKLIIANKICIFELQRHTSDAKRTIGSYYLGLLLSMAMLTKMTYFGISLSIQKERRV